MATSISGAGAHASAEATDRIPASKAGAKGYLTPALIAAFLADGGALLSDMTDTWNAGGTTFTGIKLDVTDTASAADSKLIDLLVGGASEFTVDKAGTVSAGQIARFYNGAIDTTNYERLRIDWTTTVGRVTIGPQWGGTGTAKDMYLLVPSGGAFFIRSTGVIDVVRDGVGNRWSWDASGNFAAAASLAVYVKPGRVATGSLPAAATAGAGAIMYDTTLNKLVMSTGSAWETVTSA